MSVVEIGSVLSVVESGWSHSYVSCWASSVVFSVDVSTRVDQKGGGSIDDKYGTVVKLSSYTTWNCGDTSPVRRFKTRDTFPA